MTDRIVVLCTVSRCDEPSVFSTLGLVDGRFESRCYRHAMLAATQAKTDADVWLAALSAERPEVPGQMELLD